MSRLVSSELLKLRTARTFWGFAAAIVGLVLLITVLGLALGDIDTQDDVRSQLSTAGGAALLVLVLGVVFGAGEYRHGTIAWTLLVTPDRVRAVAAKALACGIAGLVLGLVVAAVTAGIAVPWLSAQDSLHLSGSELAGLFLGGILYTMLSGTLGAGVGLLLRNQVAGIVLLLVLLFVVDPAVSALADGYAKYSLGGLATSLSGGTAEDVSGNELLPFGVAALIWAGYTAVIVAAAAAITARRDI